MLDRLTLEQFADLGGGTLALETADGDVAADLADARALASPSPRAVPPFRVVLRVAPGWRGGQGIHRVRHPVLGTMELFLVPIAQRDGRIELEAIFN
jgi:hypothetical protein